MAFPGEKMLKKYLNDYTSTFEIIFHHHLGLGDHFICNGLVYSIIEKFKIDNLHLITKSNNVQVVKNLYKDSHNISIVEMQNEHFHFENHFAIEASKMSGAPLLRISYNGKADFFDSEFYLNLGIPFINRWKKFKMPNNSFESQKFFNKLIKDDRYCLVHNVASVGKFDLNVNTDLPIYYLEKDLTDCLLNWKDVIMNAAEIHCIDSSVIHLVDSLNLKASKLYYHDVNRGSKFHVINNWLTVNY